LQTKACLVSAETGPDVVLYFRPRAKGGISMQPTNRNMERLRLKYFLSNSDRGERVNVTHTNCVSLDMRGLILVKAGCLTAHGSDHTPPHHAYTHVRRNDVTTPTFSAKKRFAQIFSACGSSTGRGFFHNGCSKRCSAIAMCTLNTACGRE
jgi:hypothetical protein